jgi:hypothetical protein
MAMDGAGTDDCSLEAIKALRVNKLARLAKLLKVCFHTFDICVYIHHAMLVCACMDGEVIWVKNGLLFSMHSLTFFPYMRVGVSQTSPRISE